MQAVFLDYETVSNGDLDPSALLRAAPDLRFSPTIGDARIVLMNATKLTRGRLEEAPDIKMIALAGTGTNNVDLAAAAERGIAVCNVRAYCTASVVQHTWSMILSLTQHLSDFARMGGRGSALAHPIRELAGRTFGVVGYGELGRASAQLAAAFGMRVVIANRPGAAQMEPGRVPLARLLESSDVISLHCPLNPETRGLIGERELAAMKTDALLINTARGALVDGAALAAALRERRIGGAGIDVLAREPPVAGDPLLDPTIPNLIVTPHVAWAAREARQRCLDEMAANIQDFLIGGRR
jgi:glycerate dehydrogenase